RLPRLVEPPAGHRPVTAHPTGMEAARADLAEGPPGRLRLPTIVQPPAGHRLVTAHPTAMLPAHADLAARRCGRLRLPRLVEPPAGHRPVTVHPATDHVLRCLEKGGSRREALLG